MTQRGDLLPSGSLAVAGGPLGRHASGRATSWLATVLPLLVAASATMALSVLERAHCMQKGWAGSDQFWHACFSDLPAQYQLGNFHDGLAAYVGGDGVRADHPVLSGAVMAWLGGLVPDGAFLDQTRWYFALWALLGTVLVLAVVALTAASRPSHAALAAHVALSPVLLMAALLSSDLFGVALVSAGIWSWSRRRPVAAGVFLGLAVTARTYPLLILLALVLLGLRTGRLPVVGRTVVAAAGAAAVVLLPFLVGNPSAILRSTQVWWDSAAGLGSVWMLPQLLGASLPTSATTLAGLVALILALGAGSVFALSTARRPTLAEVALVLVALALLAGKAFPVQSSLWLVPLVALCGLRWRDHMVWAVAEALHFVAVWLYVAGLSTPDRGLPAGWYAAFLVVRVLAVGYLVWRVWRTAAARPPLLEPDPRTAPDAIPGSSEDPRGQGTAELPNNDVSATPATPAATSVASAVEVDELEGEFADAHDRFLVRLA